MPALRLPILTYHSLDESGSVISVSPGLFRRHLEVIRDCGLRGVSLGEALASRRDRQTWPEATVALTFDDGYTNFFDMAAPALVEFGFGATVFAVSGHVGRTNDWAPPPPHVGEQAIMTWDQLRELVASGIEVAAHTVSHPDLRRMSPARVEQEMKESKERIEQEIGLPVPCFSYPYGRYDAVSVRSAADIFEASCTTSLRRASLGDRLELLPRIDAFYVQKPELLRRAILGELDGYLTVRRWGRTVRTRSLAGA